MGPSGLENAGGKRPGDKGWRTGIGLAALLGFLVVPAFGASAQQIPLSLRDSFPLGDSRGSLCQVQNRSTDPAIRTMFDRSWAIVCRDSALPVGYVFALRDSDGDAAARLDARRSDKVDCSGAGPVPATLADNVQQRNCAWRDGGLSYTVARADQGKTSYFVEGFAAYDSALSLALRSIMADEVLPGTIEIATTSIEDPAAFARVQALTLAPDEALSEGYRRNNSGDYAQASEFFETLQQRFSDPDESDLKPEEFLVNRALQKSNLGQFDEADALFGQARALGSEDIVQQRLQRNFEAIHLINQQQFARAIARLDIPVGSVVSSAETLRTEGRITDQISDRINSSDNVAGFLGFVDDLQLTTEERAYIIDAQALQLRATAARLMGDPVMARQGLVDALRNVISVRDGRVVSIIRLRAQMMSELALVEESTGNYAAGEDWLKGALELLQLQYPETSIVNAVRARLAAYYMRRGRSAEAQALYREVVKSSLGERNVLTGFGNQLAPYFDLMVGQIGSDPAVADEFFDAMQILVRPGAAETQAILARELSAGGGEASRLFRQSTNLSRAIERSRIRLAVLRRADQPENQGLIDTYAAELSELEASQQAALVRLSEFPQYRVASGRSLALGELRTALQPGEAYMKLAEVGGRVYAFFIDGQGATAYAADISSRDLGERVDMIRDTISFEENGVPVTSPYDAVSARLLYKALFGPIAGRAESASHLIFEPDGAMLRLPVNLLITSDAPVAAFEARVEDITADAFDMVGMTWLGRVTNVSTAVSSRAFVDARAAPRSAAPRQYLGMGENKAIFAEPGFAPPTRSGGQVDSRCDWPLSVWNRPINAHELVTARAIVGEAQGEVITGEAFSDDRILARNDLSDYRIVHFATHGLVTPPSSQCPARPALVTSFGGEQSDGLLSFQEIFDLKLDADMVILSACDTAARASVSVTREAGLDSGGGTALDGLVRSFIGAGGRSVLASHWPAPDDFDATERLITAMFQAPAGTGTGEALRQAQIELMDDPVTSHPYYWSGFAIIGDGARELLLGGRMAGAAQPAQIGGGN
ncbi:MAG: CHAT domain-containing tetratricopeptide repeat protein [Blastomonas sp.]